MSVTAVIFIFVLFDQFCIYGLISDLLETELIWINNEWIYVFMHERMNEWMKSEHDITKTLYIVSRYLCNILCKVM